MIDLHFGFPLRVGKGIETVVVRTDTMARRVGQIAVIGEYAATEFPHNMPDTARDMLVDHIFCGMLARPDVASMENPRSKFGDTLDGPVARRHLTPFFRSIM